MRQQPLMHLSLILVISCATGYAQQSNCSYVSYMRTSDILNTCPSQPTQFTTFTNSWTFSFQCYQSQGAPSPGSSTGSPGTLTATGAGVCQYKKICSPTETDSPGYAPSVPGQNYLLVTTTDQVNTAAVGQTLSCESGATHNFHGYCAATACSCSSVSIAQHDKQLALVTSPPERLTDECVSPRKDAPRATIPGHEASTYPGGL